ncbi:MAG: FAD-dependent thymidylate synthase [Staphylothermus sp.]|nr:FAD-dependent thymidylate synthase [Staphylothermus sp.]
MELLSVIEKTKPSVKLIQYIENAPRIIASAGKLTLSPKDFEEIYNKMTNEKTRVWIKELIKRGHGSPLEHSIYIFEVTCSRVASHQLVRHRIASYTQLSQRYNDKYIRSMIAKAYTKIKEKKNNTLWKPNNYNTYINILRETLQDTTIDFWELADIVGEAFIIPPGILNKKDSSFLRHLVTSIIQYYQLLSNGVPYEDARFVLPQAIKTRILISMNARELVESFLPLRMCSHAQWEIRYIAWSLWKILRKIHPDIFRYTGPRCILNENRIRTEPCSLEDFIKGSCSFNINRCPELVPREGITQCLIHAQKDPWEEVIKNDLK